MEKGYFLFLATLVACFPPAAPTIISSAVSNNNTRDLDALLAFKATVVDPQNILPTNWSTSTSACDWIGITCNSPHQRVAAIDLPKMDLVGTMPPQLGNLSFLVRLNLSNNSFHGNLPNELAHLRRLKYIDLAYNSFDGEIPSWLGALSQLRYLSFIHNKFSGSLSPAVFNSTKLQAIRLAQNKLGGPLPRSLFNLSSLQSLSLTNNTLSGYLPAHICDHLPQLQGVSLSYNEFGGEIPSGIGDCSKIRILSLSYNNLGGNIPREIWNITTLWSIALGGNDLQGEIPGDIGNLTNLEQLGIENANLTDEDMVGHVSDFGIAKLLGDGESWVQTKSLATIGYIAPEHGLQGLVSTRCDVYSFGITLMEAFTRKRPKDEMFTEELSIRRWIQESLHDSMNQVIDVNLLDPEDELATEKIACVSSIFELALSCTADTPEERTNIKDALTALKKIKFQLLQINNHGSSIQELTKQHIV